MICNVSRAGVVTSGKTKADLGMTVPTLVCLLSPEPDCILGDNAVVNDENVGVGIVTDGTTV